MPNAEVCQLARCTVLAGDTSNTQCVGELLGACGYVVHKAVELGEAVELLHAHIHVLVVVDIGFDNGNTFELLKYAKKTNKRCICIRTTRPALASSCDDAIAYAARLVSGADFWDLTELPEVGPHSQYWIDLRERINGLDTGADSAPVR